MANIVQFYGYRKAYGLAVSTNPLHRNPTYEPIANPDMHIRSGDLQYLVWDSFSASRTTFFANHLLAFTKKYHGRVIHVESVTVRTRDGHTVIKPIIIVYAVRP